MGKEQIATRRVTKSKDPFSPEQYVKWYEDMLLMRRFEERAGRGILAIPQFDQEAASVVQPGASLARKPAKKVQPVNPSIQGDPRVVVADLGVYPVRAFVVGQC